MKASLIVTIALRLFAMQWAVAGLIGFLGSVGYLAMEGQPDKTFSMRLLLILIVPVGYLLLAVVGWFLAAKVAKKAVPAGDPEFGVMQIGAGELYGLGVLIVGLLAFLSHLAPTFNWLHSMVINRAGESMVQGSGASPLYALSNSLFPCAGGAVLAVTSSKLGERLAR